MTFVSHSFCLSRGLRSALSRSLSAFFFSLSLFCPPISWSAPANAENAPVLPNVRDVSVRPGFTFSIADLDGDSRPDLAEVQLGEGGLANSLYRIELHLSHAGPQSISLVAPAGGLRINARDVNGDSVPDLVVSTAWTNRPVAIYLNDGHGRFSHASPTSFPAAFEVPTFRLHSASNILSASLGAPPDSRPASSSVNPWPFEIPRPKGLLALQAPALLSGSFLVSSRVRAPPFAPHS
jgi:hypothetical protein